MHKAHQTPLQTRTQKAIDMDIENAANKLLNPIEKNATLIGAGISVLEYQSGTMNSITLLLQGQVHAPNIGNMLQGALANSNVKTALMAAVAGYILKGTGNSTVSRLANILQKAATGYLVTYAVTDTLYYSTHSVEGCDQPGYVKPTQPSMQAFAQGIPQEGYGGY